MTNIKLKKVARLQKVGMVTGAIIASLGSWAAAWFLGKEYWQTNVLAGLLSAGYLGLLAFECEFGKPFRKCRKTLDGLVRNHRCW